MFSIVNKLFPLLVTIALNTIQTPPSAKEEILAPQILNTFLHQVELFVRGEAWLSQKVIDQILTFLTEWFVFTFLLYSIPTFLSQPETEGDVGADQTTL